MTVVGLSGCRLSAILISLAAIAASAQVRENVTVELIEVPVYVVGPDGNPVRGLTKENFELRVNRRATPIEYFDAADVAERHAEAVRPRERRLYLFMFDRLYASPGLLARAQKAAIQVVTQSNRDSDLFAVATYTSNHGVQFAIPFLNDPVTVAHAIATLRVEGQNDPLGLTMAEADRTSWIAAANDVVDSEIAETLKGGVAFQDVAKQPERYRITDLLFNFGDLAKRLAGLEGQKHVVMFSGGFNMDAIEQDTQSLMQLRGMFKAFQTAGVFLDTIDVAGHRAVKQSEFLGATAPANSIAQSESLGVLAHDTGGEFIHNRNDLREGITALMSSHEVVYLLAFHRRGARNGSIVVHVNGVPKGTRVYYRQGFGKDETKDVDALQLVDILTHDIAQTGFDLTLDATSTSVSVSLPKDEIVPQVAKGNAVVQTLLYVFDDRGTAVAGGTRGVDVSEEDGPIVIEEQLHLPPGHYVAKAVARIEGTTSLAFARREFTVE